VADYSGSRRAAPALTDAETQRAFAEDDAALSCPECGSLVRADHQWCTLCLHVLHAPEPEPVPEPQPEPEPVPVLGPRPDAVAAPAAAEAAQPAAPASAPGSGPASALPPEVEAAAQALLEQLAYETRQEGLKLPPYLQSTGQKAVAVAVAMTVMSAAVLLLMTILGAAIH
jgi:hypothetical protein